MHARLSRTTGAALALLAVLALSSAACDPPAPKRPRPANEKPSIPLAQRPVEGASPIGGPALVSQIRRRGGRGALVNVWASWCGSCKREIPMLLELRQAFAPQGLEVLFVSADMRSKWPDAVSFAKQAGLPLPALVVSGSLGPFKRAMSPRWRGAIPASFLFDAEGTVRHRWEGPVYEHELSPILQAFLAGENVDGETLPPVSAGNTAAP